MISGQIDLDGLARYYGIRVPYRDLLDGIWGAEVVHAALARGDATETTRLLLLLRCRLPARAWLPLSPARARTGWLRLGVQRSRRSLLSQKRQQ